MMVVSAAAAPRAVFLYLFSCHDSLFGVSGIGRNKQVVDSKKQAASRYSGNGGMADPEQPAGRGGTDKQSPPPVQKAQRKGKDDEYRTGKNRNPVGNEGVRLEVHAGSQTGYEQNDATDTEQDVYVLFHGFMKIGMYFPTKIINCLNLLYWQKEFDEKERLVLFFCTFVGK